MRLLSRVMVAVVVVCLTCGTAAAQTSKCQVRDHAEYTKKIREYTTEKFFLTELVDHLPWSSCVPAPDAHLGRIVGTPDKQTHVADINAYMRLLGQKSPRVKVMDIGKSEEGRDMLLVVISDEANLGKLDRSAAITKRLADPRGLSDAEAQKLIAEGKPFYWAATGIHSPETGGPEMMMELAYRLAVEETPFIQKIRRDSFVMLTPVVESDGRDRMVDLYHLRKKTPNERAYPLTWWGHYVAHDNNRDGMTLSLALSRNMMSTFFKFHPQVFHDLHESVPYLYISTGTGPYNAWLDPITISEWQAMAYHEIQEMTKRGVVGVWTHGFYDGWAPNYMSYLANGHNSIGRFYETFGNGGADTRVRTLGANQTNREWYRPNPPLPKVTWSLRNHVNMVQSGLLFGLHNVASSGPKFLENFYLKSKRSLDKARMEGPAAWVLPADDARPAEQARLLNLLRAQGVEVHKLDAEFKVPEKQKQTTKDTKDDIRQSSGQATDTKEEARTEANEGDGRPARKEEKQASLPAGSYVVRMDQPYSRMADMMLDTQYYSARDPRSYDDTGWTMGALRNVKTVRVTDTKILDAPMKKMDATVVAWGGIVPLGKSKDEVASRGGGSEAPASSVYVIDHNTDNTLATLRFRMKDVKMEAAEEPFELDGRKFRAGSFILRDVDAAALERHAKELELTVHAASSAPKVATHALAVPRIALMHSWQSTQNDGWYRIAMDKLGVPYTYIADTKVRDMKEGLRAQFDVIIVPPVGPGTLSWWVRGIPMRGNPMPWKNKADTPNLYRPGLSEADDIRGGLGYEGLTNLQTFVEEGGLLLAMQGSSQLPIQAGMTEMVSVVEPRNLQAPGSVYVANVEDNKSPIAYGYDEKLHVYFRAGPILRVAATGDGGFGGTGAAGDAPAARSSGRGTASDPDIIQGRPYVEPEKPVRRSPREQELYIAEDIAPLVLPNLPPKEEWPRVILRFAPEREVLHSGMLVGANEVAEKPAVVHVPVGKGNVVLFAINPVWRDETMGSFFLMFNAMLNYDHLNAGREQDKKAAD